MEEKKIIIDGDPKGKQRPRFSRAHGFTQTYTPTETIAYEKRIKKEWQKCKYGTFRDVPVEVHITAYFRIPESYSKLKKANAQSNIIKPTKKPDADNIIKIVLDGLQGEGVAFTDDKLVTDIVCRKRYAEQPRVEIIVKEVKQ